MKEQICKALKIVFLIHFFVSTLFGLVFLIFPEIHEIFLGWPYTVDPISSRILGAALLGFATASLLGWRETEWLKVKIIIQMEIAWLSVGVAISVISIFFFSPSIILWFYIVIFIVFLVAFSWLYFKQER